MNEEKKDQMREDLDKMYDKMDRGETLTMIEQIAFDIYSWLLDDSDKPELDLD